MDVQKLIIAVILSHVFSPNTMFKNETKTMIPK